MSNFNCNRNYSNYRNRTCNCLSPEDTCLSRSCRRPSHPFLSSYLEGTGSEQTITTGEDITFNLDSEALDIVGNDIKLASSGKTFIFRREGLYHVEWSINIGTSTAPVIKGLMENGSPTSALANAATIGSHSSGALIQICREDLPYELSLRNYGAPITLTDADASQNIAASIRILRFADGAIS